MSRVNTVLGPIAAEELGLVAVHEHIGYGMPGSELDTQWWKTPEQRYEETVPKLRQFAEYSRAYGGPTFVDATGICNGRDVDYYKSLSAKTGVHIVAATGFVGGDTALPLLRRGERRLPHAPVRARDHRRHRRHRQPGRDHQGRREPRLPDEGTRPAHLPRSGPRRAAHRRADLHPPGRRRGARASPSSPRRACRSTACCSGTPTTASAQGKVNETGDPRRRRPDRLRHLRLRPRAAGPAVLGPPPQASASSTSSAFIGEGHLDQVLASADANCSPLGWPGVKGHTVNYIFEDLIPDLRQEGIDDATIHDDLRREPRRLPDPHTN